MTAAEELLTAARKRNTLAMANLTMAFETEALLGLVYKAMSVNYPGGKAHLVVNELKKKFKPDDTTARVELRKALSKVSMRKGENPGKIFEQISGIQNRYNSITHTIDEEDLIAVVLEKTDAQYQSVLTMEQRIQGNKLNLEHLETALNLHWRQLYGDKPDDSEEKKEISLSAFTGICYKCGKKGHRANKCKKPNNNNGASSGNGSNGSSGSNSNTLARFQGNCNHCGKKGHKDVDCWEKTENASKRPRNYRARPGEVAAMAVEAGGTNVEFLLCTIDEETQLTDSEQASPDIKEPVPFVPGIRHTHARCRNCKAYATHNKILCPSNTGETKSVQGKSSIDDTKVEFNLTGVDAMKFPDAQSLLQDPNLWVADTGASVHNTCHDTGFENSSVAATDSITMGNGADEHASKVGDLTVTLCDQFGNEQNVAKLSDVRYLKGGKFNLFSVRKMMKEGWILSGNHESLTLTKGQHEIEFDLLIQTPKGVLFCKYLKRNAEHAQ